MLQPDPRPRWRRWESSPRHFTAAAVLLLGAGLLFTALALVIVFAPGSHCTWKVERGLTDRLVTECMR
jgi:hypothetical protein